MVLNKRENQPLHHPSDLLTFVFPLCGLAEQGEGRLPARVLIIYGDASVRGLLFNEGYWLDGHRKKSEKTIRSVTWEAKTLHEATTVVDLLQSGRVQAVNVRTVVPAMG